METWRFESVSTADTIARGQMGSMDKEINMVVDLKSDKVVNQENVINIENQMYGETCVPQIVVSSSFNPVMFATHNAFFEEHTSSSAVESNSRESGLFDLELDRIFNQENSQILSSSKITNNLNSSNVSMPSKQTRIASSNSPSPICQVHGCNKSLVSCKDYHKKHKVCELHSKSTKVIVNGIVQRFCQQCSRFHLLSEFDDGKRSCRKRLADHNERRRKITRYGSTRARSRATSSSMSMWDIKLENKTTNDLPSITNTQLHSESLSSCNSGLQYPPFHGLNTNFNPFYNKHQTSGTNDFMINMDTTPAPSLLSSQSQGGSSCHYSRNPVTVYGSNNLNPVVGCEYVNPETRVWSGNGSRSMSTIDLLQLSSELDRVEHQKQFLGIESSDWC